MVICIVNNSLPCNKLYQLSIMRYKTIAFLVLIFCSFSTYTIAQKLFSEGTIVYMVKMGPDDPDIKPGTFTLTVKGEQIKKDMKLNGMDYVIIMNCRTKKVYSLQNRNGKKYAIELNMADMVKDQEKFMGFSLKYEKDDNKKIAGCAVSWGDVIYKDGTRTIVSYSKEWKPAQPITFERFPGANFLPLDFFYKDESGLSMRFEAEKVQPGPVENAEFRIPADYKIISNAEYKELSK